MGLIEGSDCWLFMEVVLSSARCSKSTGEGVNEF